MPPKKKQIKIKPKQNGRKIGKVLFKSETPQMIFSIVQQLQGTLNFNAFRWNFKNEEFTNSEAYKLFPWFEETSINHLELNSDKNPTILKNLLHSDSFLKLKVLKASDNFITSIEDLIFFNAPVLEWIDIQSNCISSIKPLAKFKFQKMTMLRLNENSLTSLSSFQRAHIPCLSWIQIDGTLSISAIKDFLKSNINQVDYIYDRNGGIIQKHKQMKLLTNKWRIKHMNLSSDDDHQRYVYDQNPI